MSGKQAAEKAAETSPNAPAGDVDVNNDRHPDATVAPPTSNKTSDEATAHPPGEPNTADFDMNESTK